jgi:glutamine synthetase
LLAVLLAGRTGMAERREPPAPVIGNGWALEDVPGPRFPAGFEAAIRAFESSALARDNLGGRFVDAFVSDRRWQLERFHGAVTDWELQNFAEGS